MRVIDMRILRVKIQGGRLGSQQSQGSQQEAESVPRATSPAKKPKLQRKVSYIAFTTRGARATKSSSKLKECCCRLPPSLAAVFLPGPTLLQSR